MTDTLIPIDDLPGEEMIRRGLTDLAAGRVSVESLLVSIARPRLSKAGLSLPACLELADDAELILYELLRSSSDGDAYSRYNSLLRRLTSFTSALTQRAAAASHR